MGNCRSRPPAYTPVRGKRELQQKNAAVQVEDDDVFLHDVEFDGDVFVNKSVGAPYLEAAATALQKSTRTLDPNWIGAPQLVLSAMALQKALEHINPNHPGAGGYLALNAVKQLFFCTFGKHIRHESVLAYYYQFMLSGRIVTLDAAKDMFDTKQAGAAGGVELRARLKAKILSTPNLRAMRPSADCVSVLWLLATEEEIQETLGVVHSPFHPLGDTMWHAPHSPAGVYGATGV